MFSLRLVASKCADAIMTVKGEGSFLLWLKFRREETLDEVYGRPVEV